MFKKTLKQRYVVLVLLLSVLPFLTVGCFDKEAGQPTIIDESLVLSKAVAESARDEVSMRIEVLYNKAESPEGLTSTEVTRGFQLVALQDKIDAYIGLHNSLVSFNKTYRETKDQEVFNRILSLIGEMNSQALKIKESLQAFGIPINF